MKRQRKILDEWDGAGEGIKFRIVQVIELKVEIQHPEIDWTGVSEESEKNILRKRGFKIE